MQLPDRVGSENYDKCLDVKRSEFSQYYDKNEEFSGFILKINSTKIMCKGANWVPCEPFAGKDEKKKITMLLELAKEAGVNSFKRAAKAVIGSIDYDNESYRLYICNDSIKQKVKARCLIVTQNTYVRDALPETEIEIAANSSFVAFELNKKLAENEVMLFELTDEEGKCDRAFYKHGKTEIVPCDVEILEETEHYITVRADGYIHTVELEGEAVFEDNYFSLMPGEVRTVYFRMTGDTGMIEVPAHTLKM